MSTSTIAVLAVLVASVASELCSEETGLLQKPQATELLAKESVNRAPTVTGWTLVKDQAVCQSPAGPSYNYPTGVGQVQECADHCSANYDYFMAIYIPSSPSSSSSVQCRCCSSSDTVPEPTTAPLPNAVWQKDTVGMETGDPHLQTLDGKRYTLLSQGTFSLWHFSGVEAHIESKAVPAGKVPVDWQIFTHYSGQQSFTKGLLLVDRSGGSLRQTLELTSRDCRWKARKPGQTWAFVQDDQIIAVPEGKDYVTGFHLTKSSGANMQNHVRLSMNTKEGIREVAVLSLSCRANHNINVQLLMKSRKDVQFVDGELKVARKMLSTLQTGQTDLEFGVTEKWQELGGSDEAAGYLQQIDQHKPSSVLLTSCTTEEEAEAQNLCSKHLGAEMQHGNVNEAAFFQDCLYDVCHGAGEMAAQLAAELLASARAA